jgi:iron complex transport system substrate-binding protein
MVKKLLLITSVITIILLGIPVGCSQSYNSEIIEQNTIILQDMYGRNVEVPENIDKILCTGSLEMLMAFMVAPEKLLGLNFAPNGSLLNSEYLNLPVVGGWFGKQSGNYEEFISLNPDIIIEGREDTIEDRQTNFGSIPVIGLQTGTNIRDYPEAMRFLGELLNKDSETNQLLDYYEEALKFADDIRESIPAEQRVKVYYAEGNNGLSTDPSGSAHTELIDLCGGRNIADVSIAGGYGMVEVSMEQIFLWDPDVIIIGRASQTNLYNIIKNDERWQKLRAVQEGRVFVRPEDPFSWFDGPTGPNQVIGLYWTIYKLYPDMISLDELQKKAYEFYKTFYHYDLSEQELSNLLGKV